MVGGANQERRRRPRRCNAVAASASHWRRPGEARNVTRPPQSGCRAGSAAGKAASGLARAAAGSAHGGRGCADGAQGGHRRQRRAATLQGREGCGSAGLQDCDERGFLLPFSQARGIGERGGGSREAGR